MTKKQTEPAVTEAVSAYPTDLSLEGAQRPLASVAVLLASSLEAAPTYAQARIAKELRDVLGQLTEQIARDNEMAERREMRRQRNARMRGG